MEERIWPQMAEFLALAAKFACPPCEKNGQIWPFMNPAG